MLGDQEYRVVRVIEGVGRSRVLGDRRCRAIKVQEALAIEGAGHSATGLSHIEMVPSQGKYHYYMDNFPSSV